MILEAPPGDPGGEQGAPQHTNGDFAGVRVLHTATDMRIYATFVRNWLVAEADDH